MVSSRPSPLVIGHRGASGYRPEHTFSAYRLACELGADLVEPDIVATSDGVLVVRHENEISGTTDVADHPEFADRRTSKVVDGERLEGWFTEDFTWAELETLRSRERMPRVRPDNTAFDGQEGILRLSDVFAVVDAQSAALDREIGVVVEVKHARFYADRGIDLAALLITALAATGWDDRPDRLVIESFELGVLDRLCEAGVRAAFVFLAEHFGSPADEPVGAAPPRSYAWYRSDAGLDALAARVHGISVAKENLLRRDVLGRAIGPTNLVDRAHARGLRVFTWTLRPENRSLNARFQTDAGRIEWGDWHSEFAMIAASGVDGIFVDHPDLGVMIRDGVTKTSVG
ncbi:glycerophosphodiester phosphodiesterase family protein [Leucobacter musarum]|uniref:glycerophosphodiester phosphodiesterase family protein n=1 Tax=Leucobacter musarum TaxID=1930747 RepID=UPI0006A7606D|nr:glycerophosphodiester phosphodiesterase family protein [Leucobacter musarum]